MKLLLLLLKSIVMVQCHGGGGDSDKDKVTRVVSTVVTYDSLALKLNDSKWTAGRQWYLDAGTRTHNVLPAWSNCLRGNRNVTVGVVGDGVYHLSQDMKPNYNKAASYNLVDDNEDAKPASDDESWGTKTASLIGAAANEKCGVGVAFNTSIAGIRYDYKTVANLDTNLASALNKRLDQVDIFVGSLGKGLGTPGTQIQAALDNLVTKGRSGKGALLFWPSGDSPPASCALDPLVNDYRTISLASINRAGNPLTTSRSCGALLACAYSEEEGSTDPMITISADGVCGEDFSGSVPSAAFGAGITALVLQANPNLGWRDIQHLIVATSNPVVIKDPYVTNQAGRRVSDQYGFGLIDAHSITNLASTWSPVHEQRVCQIQAQLPDDNSYSGNFTFEQTTSCVGEKEIKYLEHVHVVFTLTDVTKTVSIRVTSPGATTVTPVSGVKSLTESTVTSVAFWGEEVKNGSWIVRFDADEEFTGKLTKLTLIVRGTLTSPGVTNSSADVANSGGYVTVNVTSENACPVLGPFQIQRAMTTDFTPLYIFIVLVLLVLCAAVAVVVYKRYLRERIECRGCGPAFRQVPQNGDSPGLVA